MLPEPRFVWYRSPYYLKQASVCIDKSIICKEVSLVKVIILHEISIILKKVIILPDISFS